MWVPLAFGMQALLAAIPLVQEVPVQDTSRGERVEGAGFSVLMPRGWKIEAQEKGRVIWARKVRKALFDPVQLTQLMTGVDTAKDIHRALPLADFADTLIGAEMSSLLAAEQRGRAVRKLLSVGVDTVGGRAMRCLHSERIVKPSGGELSARYCVYFPEAFPADSRFVVFYMDDGHPKRGVATPGVVLMAIKHEPELFDLMVGSFVMSPRVVALHARELR